MFWDWKTLQYRYYPHFNIATEDLIFYSSYIQHYVLLFEQILGFSFVYVQSCVLLNHTNESETLPPI